LQKRLLVCAVALVLGGAVGYIFFEQIVAIMRSPLGTDLYYNSPAGSFGFVVKICTMVGVAMTLPVLIYNAMMFLRPAFSRGLSLKQIYGLVLASVLLAVAGFGFGYYLVIPGALHFFAGFQVDGLSALITADSYLSFVTNVIITFAVVFQIPLVMILIDHIKPMTPKQLFASEKYVILAGLIISVFVPFALDLTTGLLIAAPIIVLYNLSILMIIWQHVSLKRKQGKATHELTSELDIDDAVLDEILSEPSITVEAVPSVDDHAKPSYPKSVSRAGMEIGRSSRAITASMERTAAARHRRIVANARQSSKLSRGPV
jgi:sec-independent protein translocase protein TatC